VFFRVSRARNRTGQCAAGDSRVCHQKHSSLCWSVFSCIPCEESNQTVRRCFCAR